MGGSAPRFDRTFTRDDLARVLVGDLDRQPSLQTRGPNHQNFRRQYEPQLITYNQMVVDNEVDSLFHALADATRRDLLRRSADGELSVSRLADGYAMSFAAVQKHVAVLERAGLVTKVRHGREQLVRTDPAAVARARQALDELEAAWRGRVDRMADLLTTATRGEDR